MAPWKPQPPADVGNNEHIGRRLFDEPKLRGAVGQKLYTGLDLFNFEEKRDAETSLDRLGASSVDNKVKRYLLPRAQAQGSSFKKPMRFDGWAVAPVREFRKPRKGDPVQVVASRIDGSGLAENIYHAHVVRPEGLNSYLFALIVREIFASCNMVEIVVERSENIEERRGWADRILAVAIPKSLVEAVMARWPWRAK